MERLILKYLLKFYDQHNLFSCQQHEFRAHHSCVSNLPECLNAWTQGFDNRRTGTDIIYTEFRKAFDSVPHKRLAYKLELYGISGGLLRWLNDFLDSRQQRVVCGGSESVWSHVISVVPQGTILGPFLFLLYVNGLPDQVQSQSKLFADDAKFFRETQALADCALLQQDMNHLSTWTRKWQIQFNLETCVVMRTRQSLRFTYFIDGHPLIHTYIQTSSSVLQASVPIDCSLVTSSVKVFVRMRGVTVSDL